MAQITQAKLKDLNILKLYEHYDALEKSLPLLTPESQELAKAELETCAHLRSEKVDRVYYAMASHEDALERIKKEGDLITQAKRHHEAQLKALKGLLNYLRRVLPQDSNKITGRNYQFTLVKRRNSPSRSPRTRSFGTLKKDQIIALKKQSPQPSELCLRSMSGEVLDERTEPKSTTKVLPNLDAIRSAYQEGRHLPHGVKVIQEYSVRSRRIFGEPRVGLVPSEYPGQLLPEDPSSD
jgi:hypothetical protein